MYNIWVHYTQKVYVIKDNVGEKPCCSMVYLGRHHCFPLLGALIVSTRRQTDHHLDGICGDIRMRNHTSVIDVSLAAYRRAKWFPITRISIIWIRKPLTNTPSKCWISIYSVMAYSSFAGTTVSAIDLMRLISKTKVSPYIYIIVVLPGDRIMRRLWCRTKCVCCKLIMSIDQN